MQIAGSYTTFHPVQPEPSRDRSAPGRTDGGTRVEESFAVEPAAVVETFQRVEESAEIQAPRPYPLPVRRLVNEGYARQAVAAYESVLQLQRRDGLHTIEGVDLYA
ncbi:hypothetical protein [Imhoffiella purpurea]|uniref:Uncharacterized protein n=1 Tax=Imhoffiella purpurea TaxID=1249627 RepID=W9VTI0_9GAMM|nr:hypothetical protein [Imhoffiella purpurea]EXJ13700.1 hypothetical protein D779_3455 [Imhoffiella purpurea]